MDIKNECLVANPLNVLLDSGVVPGSGGGGNCVGDDLNSASLRPFNLLDYGVVDGQGGGGNCVGDDGAPAP
jgi:hypothetical protein